MAAYYESVLLSEWMVLDEWINLQVRRQDNLVVYQNMCAVVMPQKCVNSYMTIKTKGEKKQQQKKQELNLTEMYSNHKENK